MRLQIPIGLRTMSNGSTLVNSNENHLLFSSFAFSSASFSSIPVTGSSANSNLKQLPSLVATWLPSTLVATWLYDIPHSELSVYCRD